MIKKYLKEAMDYGYDVIIQFSYCVNARFTGKIVDLDDKNFCLLYFGEENTMNWIFSIDEIKHMGIFKSNNLPVYENNEGMKNGN